MTTAPHSERRALTLVAEPTTAPHASTPTDAEADQLYAEAIAAARRAARVAGALERAATRSVDPAWAEAAAMSRRAEDTLRRAAQAVPELPAGAVRRAWRIITVGPLVIDCERRIARYADRLVSLTRLEFDLLRALAEQAGCCVTKADLLRQVWGYAGSTIRTRTVDSHASRVRRILAAAGAPAGAVENVWGVGYRLVVPESVEPDSAA